MKKLIKSIIFILLATMALFCGCFTGCFDITHSFIEDGDFKYYYIKDEDCYAIVGTTEQGFKQTVYVPTHFRGKEVRYTGLVRTNFNGADVYALKVENCERLYFSYLIASDIGSTLRGEVVNAYFVNGVSEKSVEWIWATTLGATFNVSYINASAYEKIKIFTKKKYGEELFSEVGKSQYIFNGKLLHTITKKIFMIANISYIFNYEGAPNEGYFFINNLEYGSFMEDTPYEPIRDGYMFAGWYKESECLNKWNFEMDGRLITYANELNINGTLNIMINKI
ncbi:MAG: hypothetical protein E7370_05785 [Clostridiales bacterium]|nr:hypothetical protein [Clostridiales bacterium]